MRPLRYSINVTLDGCCDHREGFADEDLHRHAVENLNRADALLFGRVTYEMMEAAFRSPAQTGTRPDWMEPFARTIDAAKKYVVSSTLNRVDFRGRREAPSCAGGAGIDRWVRVRGTARLAGHGPTLFAGLSKRIDLKLVSRLEFGSGGGGDAVWAEEVAIRRLRPNTGMQEGAICALWRQAKVLVSS
jgi:hypothetical protein